MTTISFTPSPRWCERPDFMHAMTEEELIDWLIFSWRPPRRQDGMTDDEYDTLCQKRQAENDLYESALQWVVIAQHNTNQRDITLEGILLDRC